MRLNFFIKKGDGIPSNKEEAAKYYEQAADKGFISSMNNYAFMLDNGDGIPSNKEYFAASSLFKRCN